jgi:hypothetical protein
MILGQVFIEIDDADIPPGPQGDSAYQVWLANGNAGTEADFLTSLQGGGGGGAVSHIASASLAPGANTASVSYVTTGLSCSTVAAAGESILIDVRGMVNHTGQNIVHFTLKRNGVDLTPANCSGLACSRIDIADGVRSVNFQHQDTSPSGTVTYELFWRCHNLGTAYLGRRPSDTAMMVPTTMSLTVFK